MTLTDKQCAELYKQVIEDSTNLAWIKERLEKGDVSFTEFNARLSKIEAEHSLMKGKLGSFIAGLTLIATLIVNGFIWVFGHFWSK
jgi:hypothetical protein